VVDAVYFPLSGELFSFQPSLLLARHPSPSLQPTSLESSSP
jgi:hypothetical protein